MPKLSVSAVFWSSTLHVRHTLYVCFTDRTFSSPVATFEFEDYTKVYFLGRFMNLWFENVIDTPALSLRTVNFIVVHCCQEAVQFLLLLTEYYKLHQLRTCEGVRVCVTYYTLYMQMANKTIREKPQTFIFFAPRKDT